MLAGMEEALGGFQSNLGAISTEIRSLQEQSVSLSVKLKNRKAAEAKLGELVEEIALPPELIDEILDAEVGDSYVDALQSLAKKLDFVSGSRKTESMWVLSRVFVTGDNSPVATMLLNTATLKASYAQYEADRSALYGDAADG